MRNILIIIGAMFLIWYGYKMYGITKYSDAVMRYADMPSNSLKLDSANNACKKLDPGPFFKLNP